MSATSTGIAATVGTTALVTAGLTEGIGIPTTIVFVILKAAELTAVQNWSWWTVFSPLWAGTAIAMLLGIVALVAGFKSFVDNES